MPSSSLSNYPDTIERAVKVEEVGTCLGNKRSVDSRDALHMQLDAHATRWAIDKGIGEHLAVKVMWLYSHATRLYVHTRKRRPTLHLCSYARIYDAVLLLFSSR